MEVGNTFTHKEVEYTVIFVDGTTIKARAMVELPGDTADESDRNLRPRMVCIDEGDITLK